MLNYANTKVIDNIKTVLVAVFLISPLSLVFGQSSEEKMLLNSGFNNVRQIKRVEKEIFYLEAKSFVTKTSALREIKNLFENLSKTLDSENFEVILMEERVPVYRLQASSGIRDANGKIIWKQDFSIDEKINVLSNIDGKNGRFHNNKSWSTNLIFYPQFRFKNSRLDRMYVVQANLNPTLELSLWRGAMITAQLIIPVYDEYSIEESRVRPGFVTFSQQLRLPGNFHILATVGNFNLFRSGADLKILKPLSENFSVYAQAGVTGWSLPLFDKWLFEEFGDITWRAGANYFTKIKNSNLLFNFNITKYLENDIAARGEIIRYFKNGAIGFYLQTLQFESYLLNGGFFFSIALPPYKKKQTRRINVSSADHFSIEYIARPYPLRGRMYFTSPKESSSFNFFNKQITN
jgi:hypothetical protein